MSLMNIFMDIMYFSYRKRGTVNVFVDHIFCCIVVAI